MYSKYSPWLQEWSETHKTKFLFQLDLWNYRTKPWFKNLGLHSFILMWPRYPMIHQDKKSKSKCSMVMLYLTRDLKWWYTLKTLLFFQIFFWFSRQGILFSRRDWLLIDHNMTMLSELKYIEKLLQFLHIGIIIFFGQSSRI